MAVRSTVTQYTVRSTRMRRALSVYFPNMPIILMSQDANGEPHYYGRKDIVDFLKTIRLDQIPWKEYHVF